MKSFSTFTSLCTHSDSCSVHSVFLMLIKLKIPDTFKVAWKFCVNWHREVMEVSNQQELSEIAAEHFEKYFNQACCEARRKTAVSANVIMQKWYSRRIGEENAALSQQQAKADAGHQQEDDEDHKEETAAPRRRPRQKRKRRRAEIKEDDDDDDHTLDLMGALDNTEENQPENTLSNQAGQ